VVVPERVEQGPGEGLAAGKVLGGRRSGDVDARDQAGAADLSEASVLTGQVAEAAAQVIADDAGAVGMCSFSRTSRTARPAAAAAGVAAKVEKYS
jgi:hypothetical protein